MAVAPAGVWGWGVYQSYYQKMSEARDWNTKNYDFPVIKNAGDLDMEAIKEEDGTALFAKMNKLGYINSQEVFTKDIKNPIYQIRGKDDLPDNDYYVDQETGYVYYRPEISQTNYMKLPTAVQQRIGAETPQYFGTVFTLDKELNPEDFGAGTTNFINILNNATEAFQYYDLEVNGVKIASGGSGGDFTLSTENAVTNDSSKLLFQYADSFESGIREFTEVKLESDPNRWTHDATNGLYTYDPTGDVNPHTTYFNERSLDNYVLSVDLSRQVPAGGPGWVGVQIRKTQANHGIDDSGYTIRYNNGLMELYKAQKGVVAFNDAIDFPINMQKNLTIHANGNNIKVFFDGMPTPIIEYTDDNPLDKTVYKDGYVSLSSANTATSFNNFSVKSYNTPMQLLATALKKGENFVTIKAYPSITPATTGNAAISVNGNFDTVNLSTGGIPNMVPNLSTLNGGTDPYITNELYRHSTLHKTGVTSAALDRKKAYWSASSSSTLGVLGQMQFKNREGGSLYKLKDEFSNVNALMSNLTSILGADMDLFDTHLNVFR